VDELLKSTGGFSAIWKKIFLSIFYRPSVVYNQGPDIFLPESVDLELWPLGSSPIRGQGSLSRKNIFKYFREKIFLNISEKKYLRKYFAALGKYIFLRNFYCFCLSWRQNETYCSYQLKVDIFSSHLVLMRSNIMQWN